MPPWEESHGYLKKDVQGIRFTAIRHYAHHNSERIDRMRHR